MARKSKTAVLKRQREVRKAEKAAFKREQREQRAAQKGGETPVASRDEMEGYGFPTEDEGEDEAPTPPVESTCQALPASPSAAPPSRAASVPSRIRRQTALG